MSLAGMSVPTGIAVPISLAMMHATQSNIMTTPTPSGVIVSSIPGLMGTSALTTTSSAGSLVTAVTTAGMLTTPSTVLATPSVLSLPIGVTGSLNQLMASSLKGTPQGLRTQAPPLSLLQVSGGPQPAAISLFGTLQRPPQPTQVKPAGQGTNINQPIIPSPPGRAGPTPPPATAPQPLLTTILPQQQAILAYSTKHPTPQVWSQGQTPIQATKPPPKSRKRSTSISRDQHNSRNRDSKTK